MDQGEFVRMKRHVRRYSRVLLAARDLLQVEAAAMLELFWHVREIEHIETPSAHVSGCKERFNKVFTKLQAWGLAEFTRVALLDADLLVCKQIDEIICFRDILALTRGDADVRPDERRPRNRPILSGRKASRRNQRRCDRAVSVKPDLAEHDGRSFEPET